MSTLADARTAVTQALSKISFQRADPATTDVQLAALDDATRALLPTLHAIEQAQLDQAAAAVASATDALRAITNDARLDTLGQLKQQLTTLLGQLDDTHADLFAATKLGRAEDLAAPASPAVPPQAAGTPPAAQPAAAQPTTAQPAATPPAAAQPAGQQAPAALAPPINSSNFAALRDEYQRCFDACAIRPGKEAAVGTELNRLLAGRDRYAAIAAETPGMRWPLVGIIHGMEAGYRFDRHQHNGDPLSARTVNVPAGRPPDGHPPFTWEESARDALKFDGLSSETDFSVPHLLFLFEKFNGFGYRGKGVPTPYLWGGSTLYTAGKFVADHMFSATAVSDQIGAAVLLKELTARGLAG